MKKEDFKFDLDGRGNIKTISLIGINLVSSVYDMKGAEFVIQIDRKDRTRIDEYIYELRVARSFDKSPYFGLSIKQFEKTPTEDDLIKLFEESRERIIIWIFR